ncbi:MAG: hypothetical protein CMM77_08930 [Rhodospirillaceae bacterium]|nr:hypothetical protein [Magnetovibrio sp.]MAY67237.1 hypothetical protein [Rhodospirillaceae bacterium]|tara:strand:+ start:363 stop:980 length:618 start_codon:yes stop_codon:yes gene_type:complete
MRIGIDLDNTLACYDAVFAQAAVEAGLIPSAKGHGKQTVRAAVRALKDGETQWMALQGQVYGRLMGAARLIDGADEFLAWCRTTKKQVWIVSHKTRFGHMDPDRVDLRQAARSWLDKNGFFDPDGFAVPEQNVFFESTRQEKVRRIADLGIDLFIDDLWEVFNEPGFPATTRQVLLERLGHPVPIDTCTVCRSWREIHQLVRDAR